MTRKILHICLYISLCNMSGSYICGNRNKLPVHENYSASNPSSTTYILFFWRGQLWGRGRGNRVSLCNLAVLELTMWPRLALSLWSFCLCFLIAGIIGILYHAKPCMEILMMHIIIAYYYLTFVFMSCQIVRLSPLLYSMLGRANRLLLKEYLWLFK
jgi:hypothetical protein